MWHVDDGQLHALLDGELDTADPEGAGAIEVHLAECAECRARLEAQQELHARIHGLISRSGPRDVAMPPFEELAAKAAADVSRASRWAQLANPQRVHAAAWIASFVIILAGTAGLVLAVLLGRFAAEEDRGDGAAPTVRVAEPAITGARGTFTRPPRLENPEAVDRAVRRFYPPHLRDGGIGGTALVRALVDENGRVRAREVARSSGHHLLDVAALRVVDELAFTPARDGDRRVSAWIELPIVFRPR
ncbi:MAG: TonB family protein [Gemmatimonadetes bacterium]|nr:TonB family protein [Gemmatimonadota bacterium]